MVVHVGIYHLVWLYRVNREMADLGRARGEDLGDSPPRRCFALFLVAW